MTYYKNFQRIDGLLKPQLPLTAACFPEFYYKPEEWNFPPVPNSKLFCWDNLENSILHRFNTNETWIVEVKNPIHVMEHNRGCILDSSCLTTEFIEAYWKNPYNILLVYCNCTWLDIIFADAVKLVERVK